ncbi:MAG TPA: hypothetical protein ENK12_00745 [Gammaproteobacteria bacterium]|nr:hypothetical protein [Gammaproteobacteria bacterium]
MNRDRKIRVPAGALALDLIGALVLLVGAAQLAGIGLPFLPADLPGHGWPFVAAGAAFMVAGTLRLLSRLLAAGAGPDGGAVRRTPR